MVVLHSPGLDRRVDPAFAAVVAQVERVLGADQP